MNQDVSSVSQPPQPPPQCDLVWLVLRGPAPKTGEDGGQEREDRGKASEVYWVASYSAPGPVPGTLYLSFRPGNLSSTSSLPYSMYRGRLVESSPQACSGSFESHLTDQKAETQRSDGSLSKITRSAKRQNRDLNPALRDSGVCPAPWEWCLFTLRI